MGLALRLGKSLRPRLATRNPQNEVSLENKQSEVSLENHRQILPPAVFLSNTLSVFSLCDVFTFSAFSLESTFFKETAFSQGLFSVIASHCASSGVAKQGEAAASLVIHKNHAQKHTP